jgi:membrane-bound inhibitor of C-type lysozyme
MKSSFRILLIIASISILSCTTTDYIGKTYSKTNRVEIFFSSDEIKREYEVMGQIKAEAPEAVKFEVMEQKLVKDAMEKGADAILIGELKTVEVGSVTSASGKTYGDAEYYLDKNMKLKKRGGSDHYTQLSTTTIVKDHVIDAKLLKYK